MAGSVEIATRTHQTRRLPTILTGREWTSTLAFLLPLLVYLVLPASTMNGDGLRYYDCARQPDWQLKFTPGHVLYCPLMTVLGRLAETVHPSALRPVMVLANQLAAASGVYLLWRIAGRLGANTFGQWMAALGLAGSFGFWIQAIDVETYALAVFFVIASVSQMVRYADSGQGRHLIGLGALNSVAALVHITTLALVASSLCLIVARHWRAPRRMIGAVGAYGATVALLFVLPVLLVGAVAFNLRTLEGLRAWVMASGHGYRVIIDALLIPRALYGLARTFVFLEFFWEASPWSLALKGVGLLAAGVWVMRRIPSWWHRLALAPKTVLGSALAFVVPQAAFGAYFFGSDTERWIFIAPFVWLAVAGQLSLLPMSRRRVAIAAVSVMCAVNLGHGIWPAATDASTGARVLALDQVVPSNVLLVTPGQDWTGYYRYFTARRVESLDLITTAIRYRDDHRGFYEYLERRIAEARKAGRPVVMIRILDPSENYRSTPWQDLAAFGYTADSLRQWVVQFSWEEQRLSDPDRTRVYWLR